MLTQPEPTDQVLLRIRRLERLVLLLSTYLGVMKSDAEFQTLLHAIRWDHAADPAP
jgi:hypothetical protein